MPSATVTSAPSIVAVTERVTGLRRRRPSLIVERLRGGRRRIRSRCGRSGRARRSRRRSSPGRCREQASRPGRRARRAASRSIASSWRTVPTRHGTHWPHDSSRKNAAMRRIWSTRSTCWSSTITTPEPSESPAARTDVVVEDQVELVGADEIAGRAAEEHGLQLRTRRGARRPARSARRASGPARPRRRPVVRRRRTGRTAVGSTSCRRRGRSTARSSASRRC